MRTFAAGITTEIQKEYFMFFFLLELEFDTTYRITDMESNYHDGTNVWLARNFTFTGLKSSMALSVDKLDVEWEWAD